MVATLLILLLLAVVIAVISRPLLVARRAYVEEESALAELEAAREAKYREIHDAELDYRTGKMSAQDYSATDAVLRSEAMAILRRLEGAAASGESTRSEAVASAPPAAHVRTPRSAGAAPAAPAPARRSGKTGVRRRRTVRPPLDH